MKVKLIQMTQNPIDAMWTAARTCYASGSPIDMWENSCTKRCTSMMGDWAFNDYMEELKQRTDKQWKLVQQVLDSGHLSIAEHVSFTFAIEGISRACSHQLVRHRHCTFSQQSQRYVEIKEDLTYFNELYYKVFDSNNALTFGKFKDETKEIVSILKKYFTEITDDTATWILYGYATCLYTYLHATQVEGVKPEDARSILPNVTKTNLVMTLNYRELMHICNERLCTRAQAEIRQLAKLMVEEVKKQDEHLSQYLVPKCEIDGFCREHKCCGRKPRFKEVLKDYENNKRRNNV